MERDTWDSDPLNKAFFTTLVKQKCEQAKDEMWINETDRVQGKSGKGLNKLRNYRRFKRERVTEEYLKVPMNRKHRASLARFRAGVPRINIELGRYRQLPVEKRTCFNCIETVEDECHVLLKCPLYNHIRYKLFSGIIQYDSQFLTYDDETKLGIILSCSNITKMSARACFDIMQERNKHILV